jgi:putative two-component system response regulator
MEKPLQHNYKITEQNPCRDSLTGLFSHDFFQLSLDRELERSRRYGTPFVLALLDIDNFKVYNSKYGKLAGNILLKGIASFISPHRGLRQSDLAARIDSDRFAVLLVEITLPVARKVFARIHREISETLGPNFSLSISIVSFPGNAATKETLFFLSEDLLTQAKESTTQKIFWEDDSGTNAPAHKADNILVVDDDLAGSYLMVNILEKQGFTVFTAESGNKALQCVVRENIDLILLDVMMPDMDGFEFCSILKQTESTRRIPIILVTALDSVEAKVKGIKVGADDFITKPPVQEELLARIVALIQLKKSNSNLTSIENVLVSLANIIEEKDSKTEGHIRRVASMALEIGKRFGMQKDELESLKLGGILHDIGKIGISRKILKKRERLTEDEWDEMKKHVETGYQICLPLQQNLGSALEIIRHHHEKLDGSGYPDGLSGAQLSLPVRIMTVVDMYDALTTHRPYRPAISPQESLAIVESDARDGLLDMEVVNHLKYFLNKQKKVFQPRT